MFLTHTSTKPEFILLTLMMVMTYSAIGVAIGIPKGQAVAGFLLGLLLGPLGLGLLILSSGTLTHCPFCCQKIKQDALICRHCGQDVSVPTT